MPENKDFSHRIEILDECLRRNKKWTFAELIECVNSRLHDRFGKTVSRRTLFDDLNYLIHEKGAPVEKIREGTKVYYRYSEAGYSIKNLPLNDEEIVLLKDAVSVLKQIGGLGIVQDIETIVSRLENSFAAGFGESHCYIQFEKHTTAAGTQRIDDLFTAVKEKIVLRITYQPFGKDLREHLVHPYLLKEYRNRWFLIGRSSQGSKAITLALDRIREVRSTREPFAENNLFDPETYFNNIIGVSLPEGEEVQDIIIRVLPGQVPYVLTKPIHFTQETLESLDDGTIRIRLRLINNYELQSVLLSYGAGLEVEQPLALRERMKELFSEACGRYR